jgi:hypothetical protein
MKPKKEVKQPTEEDREKAGFVLGYDWRWMKKIGNEHPDYEKVMAEVKKRKLE